MTLSGGSVDGDVGAHVVTDAVVGGRLGGLLVAVLDGGAGALRVRCHLE